jgi:hypothetical protein
MLKTHADRVISTFAVHFDALMAGEAKIGIAAEVIQSRLKAPHWGLAPGKYVLRDTVNRMIYVIHLRGILVQNLGMDQWVLNLDEHLNIIKDGLKKLGVDRIKRIGFNTAAFLPLGMSHPEIVDLMFGSYLMPATDFQELCGKPEDTLIQLHGEHNKMKTQVDVVPMTSEQAVQGLLANPNLEAFVEPKLLDTGVKEFRDRIAFDCLHVAVDLARTDVTDTEISFFGRQALDAADKITEAAVQKLKTLRVKKGR